MEHEVTLNKLYEIQCVNFFRKPTCQLARIYIGSVRKGPLALNCTHLRESSISKEKVDKIVETLFDTVFFPQHKIQV